MNASEKMGSIPPEQLARTEIVPVGAIVHYVLCRWASEGSSALLELGPRMTRRLREPFETAEAEDTDEARLAAYEQVRQMIEWLNFPLDNPEVYDDLNG